MTKRLLAAILCTLMTLSAPAVPAPAEGEAPQPTLKAGDPAPPLKLDRWLKGNPIDRLERGKIYVMEFWATWCGPCVIAMPHVTALQAKYQDQGVVVVGVNVLERDPAAVEKFMKKKGNRMGYPVVTEQPPAEGERAGQMAKTWIEPTGRGMGVPVTFLIDREGKIAWIGHPMMLDRPLAQLVAGKFDPAEHQRHLDEFNKLMEEFSEAMKASDFDKALATVDRVMATGPAVAEQLETAKISVLMRKKDYAAASALATEIGKRPNADETQIGSAAGALLGSPEPDKVDVKLALQLAQRAYELNGNEGWQFQALLSRAHAVGGAYDKAVELLAAAVAAPETPEQLRPQLQRQLDDYKARQQEGKK